MALQLSSYPDVGFGGHLRSVAKSLPHVWTAIPVPRVQATPVEVRRSSDRYVNVAPTSAWRQF
jgi:hypothetical protein